jgi:hypothetical protein
VSFLVLKKKQKTNFNKLSQIRLHNLSVPGTQIFFKRSRSRFPKCGCAVFQKCFENLKFSMGVRAGIKVMKADTIKTIVFRLHQVEWKKSI